MIRKTVLIKLNGSWRQEDVKISKGLVEKNNSCQILVKKVREANMSTDHSSALNQYMKLSNNNYKLIKAKTLRWGKHLY